LTLRFKSFERSNQTMKKRSMKRALSAVLTLCMALPGASVAFGSVSAATVSDDSSTSASSTAAGSLVEDDGFTWDNANVYFLLTDRFKNGNTANDHSYGRTLDKDGKPLDGWDTNPGTFHGGDFAGVTQSIEEGYFDNLGVNAIWISAPYEQTHGYCDSGKGFAHYSYHGYYVLDYTETDANFGTKEEFKTLVDTAHEHGIRVIMDIVMNHTGYNTVADMEQFGFGTLLDGALDYKYKLTDVSDVNDHIDYKTSEEDWGKWWSNDWIRSGLPGYTEGAGGDLTMSLSGLPDFRTEQTKAVTIPPILQTKWKQEGTYDQKLAKYGKSNTVTGYLSTWLSEWVKEYGVDGFRCDTAKHVDKASWNQLKQACVSALREWRSNNKGKAGADWKEDFWMTGEHWDHGVGYDTYYSEGGFDSMINFAVTGGGALASGSVANTYQGYADQINTKEGFNVLSFMSSHDETLTRGDENTMLYNAAAFLLLPGGVQIFYGDETNRPLYPGVAFDGYGGSGHALRSDMNWNDMDKTLLAQWQKVGQFRNKHVSIGAGANVKLSATSGVAFGRTYDKNGVTDQAAAVIGCNKNSSVTVDVSTLWEDGSYVINTYDNSSSVVTDGKVTFNSGVNGTILMENADGQPLVSITGEPKFYGTEQVTVSLKECDSAKVSVDGGNKFVVKDGDTFTIGQTAYKNDTIEVTVEATNDKASSEAKFTFLKLGENDERPTTSPTQSTTVPGPTASQTSKLTIKSTAGAPNVYAWTGASTALNGAWPGQKAAAVSGQANTYELTLPVSADKPFSVVLNNGSGTQSGDITGLYDGAVLEIQNGNYTSVKTVTNGNQQAGGDPEPAEGSVSVTIKPYSPSASYKIYAWNDTQKLTGAWPGVALTEKDSDGNYVVKFDNVDEVNIILSSGSGQTADITGVRDGATIEITNEGCTTYKLTSKPIVVSPYESLKKEARKILAMTASDYTAESWANAQKVLKSAEAMIKAGEDATTAEAMNAMIADLKSAQKALVLAPATLTYAVAGKSVVSGVTASAAKVTVTVDGKTYTATADDVTGAFTVATSALKKTSTIKVDATRNGVNGTYSYAMNNGDIESGIVPTSPIPPTQPTTSAQPTTTQPATKPTTQPATQPTTQPATEPTTAPSQTLTVNATSNYFGSATKTDGKVGDKITVLYKLNANMGIVDGQWTVKYDTSKLKFDKADNKVNGSQTIMPSQSNLVYNAYSNVIKGNFTNPQNPTKYDGGTYISLTFQVIGAGSASVYLDTEYLTVGYVTNNKLNQQSVVDNSKVRDISGFAGFKNVKLSATTSFASDVRLGDVDMDGKITAIDVTLVQKHITEHIPFTEQQLTAADVDKNNIISVKDATLIQKYVVHLISNF
jgi:glycosidase